MYFQIGLLATIGLAAKNAILIVEFAKELHDKGGDLIEATIEASRMRLRPILMTSLAFVLGMLPMVLASGPGSASRHSIGTGVFFGMLVAITVGIVLVPFFFVLIYKIKGKMRMERIAQKKEVVTVVCVVSMLAFSSCKIGKRYARPELNLPDRIEAYTDTTDTVSVENIPWESLYADVDLERFDQKGSGIIIRI